MILKHHNTQSLPEIQKPCFTNGLSNCESVPHYRTKAAEHQEVHFKKLKYSKYDNLNSVYPVELKNAINLKYNSPVTRTMSSKTDDEFPTQK